MGGGGGGGRTKIFSTLYILNNFTYARIEIKIIKSMSDSELSRLGVTTIGKLDRYWKKKCILFAADINS